MPLWNPDVVTVRENSGANVGTQPRLNFIEGTNVTLTTANDSANNEVDITIAASGSGGGDPEYNRIFMLMGA